MSDSFFHARVIANAVETRGVESCLLGTPLGTNGRSPEGGIFALWEWDGEHLIARNDRLGFYPVYYFQRPGEICISPSIFKILEEGCPKELDFEGLSVFLRLGNFIDEDTPFKEIRLLPPGATLRWSREGFQLASLGLPEPKLEHISFDDAIDRYIELFAAAIERQCPPSGNFAVPLSGGRDSRHILLELVRKGYKPRFCITSKYYPPLMTPDPDIAAQLAALLDVGHEIMEPEGPELDTELRKNIITNLCSFEHGWMLTMADYLAKEVESVYDGIGGDILSTIEDEFRIEDKRYELFSTGKFVELADMLLGTIGSKRIFSSYYLKELSRDVAVHHLAGSLEKYACYPNPSGAYWFWARTRRVIALAPFGILDRIPRVFTPFLDHDLCDFLTSLPREIVVRTDFHSKVIERAYPEYAHVPYSNRIDYVSLGRKTNKRLVYDFSKYLLRNRPKRILKYGYIVPRLAAALFTDKYSMNSNWIVQLVTYLCQLERAASGEKTS